MKEPGLHREPGDLGRLGVFINIGGVVCAAVLMLVGVALGAVHTPPAAPVPLPPREIFNGLLSFGSTAWTTAGCLLLIATPLIRVVLITGAFARAKRPGFVWIGFLVLVILTVGICLSIIMK